MAVALARPISCRDGDPPKLLTDPTYVSFCDVSSNVSCTQAYVSRYGSFMGVPVALGGVIFFAVAAALAGIGGSTTSRARDNAPGYIFIWSTIGLAFVMYLAWASYVVLGLFCILCAITYVSVIALFIISGGATKYPMTSMPGRAARDLRTLVSSPIALAMLLVIGVGSAVLIASFPSEQVAQAAQEEAGIVGQAAASSLAGGRTLIEIAPAIKPD